jgi:hypothetical protein
MSLYIFFSKKLTQSTSYHRQFIYLHRKEKDDPLQQSLINSNNTEASVVFMLYYESR